MTTSRSYFHEAIEDYDPALQPPVTNRVHWPVDWSAAAVLLHDPQVYYLDALGPTARNRVVTNMTALVAAAKARGAPVFASRLAAAAQPPDRGLLIDFWGAGPARTSDALAPELDLGDRVQILAKRTYSVYLHTDLEVTLRRRGHSMLLIAGVYTSIGPFVAALESFMRDIRPVLVADALADFRADDHNAALGKAARICARVASTQTCLAGE